MYQITEVGIKLDSIKLEPYISGSGLVLGTDDAVEYTNYFEFTITNEIIEISGLDNYTVDEMTIVKHLLKVNLEDNGYLKEN